MPGFLLNNEMDDFAAAPGRPNLYGLVQGEANAVGPGKRMLSSMTPTVAWRGGEVIALGSPGWIADPDRDGAGAAQRDRRRRRASRRRSTGRGSTTNGCRTCSSSKP